MKGYVWLILGPHKVPYSVKFRSPPAKRVKISLNVIYIYQPLAPSTILATNTDCAVSCLIPPIYTKLIMSPWTHHLKNIDKGCPKPLTSASPLSEEQLNKIFNRYDTNGDGHLSWEELKSAYNILGMSFPGLRALRALCVADENRDGYISQKEFIKLMRKNYRK